MSIPNLEMPLGVGNQHLRNREGGYNNIVPLQRPGDNYIPGDAKRRLEALMKDKREKEEVSKIENTNLQSVTAEVPLSNKDKFVKTLENAPALPSIIPFSALKNLFKIRMENKTSSLIPGQTNENMGNVGDSEVSSKQGSAEVKASEKIVEFKRGKLSASQLESYFNDESGRSAA